MVCAYIYICMYIYIYVEHRKMREVWSQNRKREAIQIQWANYSLEVTSRDIIPFYQNNIKTIIPRLRHASWLEALTLSCASVPCELHAERPDVPAFTGVNDEHFNAYVARNLRKRHFSNATRQSLSQTG